MDTIIHKHELFKYLREHFALDWNGIHGAGHWARVWRNGRAIARAEGAREDVVWLFSFLHDHQRVHDGEDTSHGWNAVVNAAENLRGRFFEIDEQGWMLLVDAMNLHSDGFNEPGFDITIRTCWDADRLDLGRVGITPNPKYLCTETAKDPFFLRGAYARSIGGFLK
jgi:uncharacterized protein